MHLLDVGAGAWYLSSVARSAFVRCCLVFLAAGMLLLSLASTGALCAHGVADDESERSCAVCFAHSDAAPPVLTCAGRAAPALRGLFRTTLPRPPRPDVLLECPARAPPFLRS